MQLASRQQCHSLTANLWLLAAQQQEQQQCLIWRLLPTTAHLLCSLEQAHPQQQLQQQGRLALMSGLLVVLDLRVPVLLLLLVLLLTLPCKQASLTIWASFVSWSLSCALSCQTL
jgi:hypothetical protein